MEGLVRKKGYEQQSKRVTRSNMQKLKDVVRRSLIVKSKTR